MAGALRAVAARWPLSSAWALGCALALCSWTAMGGPLW